mgnify:CR=1 FL=1
MARRRNKRAEQQIAQSRIDHLMAQAALQAKKGDYALCDRYIQRVRILSMKYLTPLKATYKDHICKNCHRYLLSGTTSTTRINRGHLTITCKYCGHHRRIPYKKTAQKQPKTS